MKANKTKITTSDSEVVVDGIISKRTIRDAIDEHWRGESVKYFDSSDLLNMINGETYLKYEYKKANQVVIYFGNNDGETAIKVCWTAKQIDDLVKSIIF